MNLGRRRISSVVANVTRALTSRAAPCSVPGRLGRSGGLRRAAAIAAALVAAMAAPLRAGIEWQHTRIILDPPAGAAMAVAEFEFVNRGSGSVRVTDVHAGCGCTAMAVEPREVAPGGKGKVKATYNTRDRSGHQKVSISVQTEEPEARRHELALEVRLKDFATLTPSWLFWRVGAEVAAKEVELRLLNDFQFVDVRCSGPEFSAEVVERSAGRVRLKVTPRDLWAQRSGSIRVSLAQPGHAPVELDVPIRVL